MGDGLSEHDRVLLTAGIEAMREWRNWPVVLVLHLVDLTILLGAVRLAMRHPGFPQRSKLALERLLSTIETELPPEIVAIINADARV